MNFISGLTLAWAERIWRSRLKMTHAAANQVSLNIGVNGLEFKSPDLEIKDGSITATEFVGDGSKLTSVGVGARFVDVINSSTCCAVNPGDIYIQQSEEGRDTCENNCHDAWTQCSTDGGDADAC